MPVDYKALLKKYMWLVIQCEGISFLDSAEKDDIAIPEMSELRSLESEIYEEEVYE